MRKKLTIGKKLILCFTILSLIQTSLICFVVLNKSKSILDDNLEITSSQTIQQVDEGFTKYLNGIDMQLEMMLNNQDIRDVRYLENREVSTEYVQELLHSVKNSTDDFLNVYYGGEYGEIILENESRNESEFDYKNRVWYKKAIESNGQIIYTEPYVDNETNDMVITVAKAVEEEGKIIGVFGVDLKLATLKDYISNISVLKSGYAVVLKDDGEIVINSDKNIFNIDKLSEQEFWNNTKTEENGIYRFNKDGNKLIAVQQVNKNTGWKIVGIIDENEILDNMNSIRNTIFIIGIFSSILVIGCSIAISLRLTKPIVKLSSFMNEIAKGDFSSKTDIKTGDELEDLGENINHMINNVSSLISNVNETIKDVLVSSENILNMSELTKKSIVDVSSAIGEVSTGATDQMNGMQMANMSMEELTNKIKEVSIYTNKIKELSRNSEVLSSNGLNMLDVLADKANKTKENSDMSTNIVREMSESISNINIISDTIMEITEQTNLLSLNASIEAARAGEMGKGFAIVAEEIRLLSEQSKKSTDDIKLMVDEIILKAKNAEEAMRESTIVLKEQDEAVGETEEVFKGIITAIDELSDGVNKVQGLNSEMDMERDKVTSQMDNVARISEESAAVSEEVNASAEEVNLTMSELVQHSESLKETCKKLENEMKQFKF